MPAPLLSRGHEAHFVGREELAGARAAEADAGDRGGPHGQLELRHRIGGVMPEDVARAMPQWSSLWVMVELPPEQAAANVQQVYDAYASLFYVAPPDPAYTIANAS